MIALDHLKSVFVAHANRHALTDNLNALSHQKQLPLCVTAHHTCPLIIGSIHVAIATTPIAVNTPSANFICYP